jgi:hypothetical protein
VPEGGRIIASVAGDGDGDGAASGERAPAASRA